jgi:hypothetical protein
MSIESFGTIKVPILELPLGSPEGKVTFGCNPHEKAHNIL